ncbi:MAG: histidine phosphatase family protein [Prevotella sp.]|nr:histidine phosphatase family protein [Prevotella sp.]
MTTLYLVRHGETVDNANQIMQGQTQGELNANGIHQAEQVREEWREKPLDVVIASDLKRSVDTATIIAEPHHLEVQTTPLLRERDWGDFTGRFIPDLKGETWPDNVETLENLLSRAGEFITYVKETYPGKKVLAVGHGIINKAIQAVYYGKSMSEVQRMMNAEVRVLEL